MQQLKFCVFFYTKSFVVRYTVTNVSTLFPTSTFLSLFIGMELVTWRARLTVAWFLRARASARISYGNSVCLSVYLSARLLRPHTVLRPGEIVTSGFHRMIA